MCYLNLRRPTVRLRNLNAKIRKFQQLGKKDCLSCYDDKRWILTTACYGTPMGIIALKYPQPNHRTPINNTIPPMITERTLPST